MAGAARLHGANTLKESVDGLQHRLGRRLLQPAGDCAQELTYGQGEMLRTNEHMENSGHKVDTKDRAERN
jgi:hypothetical protein